LHPVGPMVLAGGAFFSWERIKEVTEFYLDFVKNIPDELTTALFYWGAPPAPFLPESIHGKNVAIIGLCYAGSIETGEKVVAPIRALKPTVDIVGPMPYAALQAMFDPIVPKGTFAYVKSDYFDAVPAAMVDEIIRWAERKPCAMSMARLNHFGGAMSRIAEDATPFAQRNALFAFSPDALWTNPEEADASVQWAKGCWQALRAYSPRGAYVNFMDDEGQDRVRESYRGNYERLVQIKRKYDTSNLFRLNQNIKP